MLGQSKTVQQAEIDAACELIDFLRFNVQFAQELVAQQPCPAPACATARTAARWKALSTPSPVQLHGHRRQSATAGADGQYRGVEAIGHGIADDYLFMELLEEAGLPPGVINFVPGDPPGGEWRGAVQPASGRYPLHRLHSGVRQPVAATAQHLPHRAIRAWWARPAARTCAGPPSADAAALAPLVRVRSSSGQKCSAASRAYIPSSLWPQVKERMLAMLAEIRMGDVRDFSNFMGAVIDRKAFQRIKATSTLPGPTAAASWWLAARRMTAKASSPPR
jgi:1-pyrroline-5-carboxylate dehydrogenase